MASRFKTILAKTLIRFVGDALPQRAADQEQSSIAIPRVSTSLGAAFGEKITDQDITFAVKREPVAHRIVFTVAHDIYVVDKNKQSPRFGEPEIYTVMQSENESVEVHHSRVIHFATRKLEPGYKGISILRSFFSLSTSFSQLRRKW